LEASKSIIRFFIYLKKFAKTIRESNSWDDKYYSPALFSIPALLLLFLLLSEKLREEFRMRIPSIAGTGKKFGIFIIGDVFSVLLEFCSIEL
jgi:hypothetical protein